MARWLFYSYPSCSSCRDAESVLKRKGIEYERIHIYDDPPDREKLKEIASRLPGGVADLISTRGTTFRELGLAGKNFSSEEWLDLIEKYPRLLRRPILTDGESVIVGFKKAEYEERMGARP